MAAKNRPKHDTLADYFRANPRTQDRVARAVGISPAHLSMIVSRQRQPSLPVAVRLAEATGVPADRMVAGTGPTEAVA